MSIQASRNKLRRYGTCETSFRCLSTAQIVAARFIALMLSCTVSIQASRNKLRRYGTCEISFRCLLTAHIVAARFIALMFRRTVPVRPVKPFYFSAHRLARQQLI
ncbi:hypothetical protein SA4R_10900 [Pantoea dispersa]|nr:hypothetical protein SA4R_10900 [Pantoea dispersa]